MFKFLFLCYDMTCNDALCLVFGDIGHLGGNRVVCASGSLRELVDFFISINLEIPSCLQLKNDDDR